MRPFEGDTDIFIYPGYAWKVTDALMTNFHLPKSTLMMLVSALMGARAGDGDLRPRDREEIPIFSHTATPPCSYRR